MKHFLRDTVLFLFCAMFVLLLAEGYYFYSHAYEQNVNGWEVYTAIRNSLIKKTDSVKRLLIGDSVAMQMYPCDQEYDDMVSLTCNQAITFAGYYFLLNNYLQTNPDNLPSEVVILVTPFTLASAGDEFMFHYFLKPFYRTSYQKDYTQTLSATIASLPCPWLSQLPFIRSSNYTIDYLPTPQRVNPLLSTITDEYMCKMHQLSQQYGFQLYLLPAPIRESRRIELEERIVSSYAQDMSSNSWENYLQSFIKSIVVYPDSMYQDPIHFSASFIPKHYLNNILP
ncbi:MAG: hypothetical protein NC038_03425 [Paludibacter sp.]|nr:hypothetical protein [Bacteroidales bacterium]MCM1069079.1 hypothetical protein [Prevotella sp.]MCM1353518.1 hypothetical protein [Bacteroides sp.]MCM1442679.1 hypothetical protein [Muribaculum sp.]MCM1481685.1 hypothetical protein [Paludibacter sp.]